MSQDHPLRVIRGDPPGRQRAAPLGAVRSAIVTGIGWMARATKPFLWTIPGEARVFPCVDLDAARAWVAGDRGRVSRRDPPRPRIVS
jgi:hypothetical protein